MVLKTKEEDLSQSREQWRRPENRPENSVIGLNWHPDPIMMMLRLITVARKYLAGKSLGCNTPSRRSGLYGVTYKIIRSRDQVLMLLGDKA